jgi:multiple sugar transport system permease protein
MFVGSLRSKAGKRLTLTICYGILVAAALVTVIPFAYMVVSSLKTNLEVLQVPFQWIPKTLHLENYLIPLREKPLERNFLNSLIVALSVTLGQVTTCSMAGYGLSKFNFPGRDAVFLIIITQLMIPFQVIMVPLFLIVRDLGWINTYAGLIVPLATHAFGIFLMRQFIAEVPDSLIEAARIDGASEPGIFLRVVAPLSKPGMTALAVFCFTGNWNEFVWPTLIINTEDMYTLPIALATFEGMYTTNYPQLMAVAFLSTVPTLLAFFLLQKQLTQGVVLSGLKQ